MTHIRTADRQLYRSRNTYDRKCIFKISISILHVVSGISHLNTFIRDENSLNFHKSEWVCNSSSNNNNNNF